VCAKDLINSLYGSMHLTQLTNISWSSWGFASTSALLVLPTCSETPIPQVPCQMFMLWHEYEPQYAQCLRGTLYVQGQEHMVAWSMGRCGMCRRVLRCRGIEVINWWR
jgi:hypothetical protein